MEVTWLCWASHQLGSGGRGCVTRDSVTLCSVTLCNYVLVALFPAAVANHVSRHLTPGHHHPGHWSLVSTGQVTSHTPANSFSPRSLVIAVQSVE